MTIEEYQKIVKASTIYPKEIRKLGYALGICGEAGEVAEKIKKLYRDNQDIDINGNSILREDTINETFINSIGKEIGDVIWYCTSLANEFGITLEDILIMNATKIIERRKTNTIGGSGDDREKG